mmetsp:Transcript_49673/g.115947  ORF Transcript_49673/g.115947 Transcript_49673/m.115947 type:complete len:540 (+) Transcript_49673:72-1691(+)
MSMKRSTSGLKANKSRGQMSQDSDEPQAGLSQKLQNLFDFIITGDFKGLCRNLHRGIIGSVRDLGQRADNTFKWYNQRRKEHELRATDWSLPHPYPKIRYFVSTTYFEVAGNFVIFCNTFVVGWQAGLTPKVITQNDRDISAILENIFTTLFVLELTLSTLCWGWTSLVKKENWLDVFLVGLGVLTTWVFGLLGIEVETLRKLTALRTIRLVRLARSVRLRPEFKDMWSLIKGLTESGETLLWTYVMIFCVLYFFAIIATSLIGKSDAFLIDFTEEEKIECQDFGMVTKRCKELLAASVAHNYFGDVLVSMLSLFQLMTLDSWTGDMARPLMFVAPWTAFFFIFFISVAVFVMLNLVTAVIVENAISESNSEEKELAVRIEREKEDELEDLKQFFLQIDMDGSGSLSKQEFFRATKQKKVRQKLRALDIMPKDIDELWDILKGDEDGSQKELTGEEFVNGIRKLRGEARAKDILRLYKEVRQFEQAVDTVEGHIKSSYNRLENIKKQLARCRTDIAAFTRTIVRAKEAVKMAAQTQNMS